MPTYHLTIFPLPVWARKSIDKIRRSFFWKGEENANGGHCLVNWPTVSRPKDLGGLGVPDLEKFSRALQLRWLWQEWVDTSKPWVGMEVPCNDLDRALFNASTRVTIGDGRKARFWHDSWLDGEAPKFLAPSLFEAIRFKNRNVHSELQNNAWIAALRGGISTYQQVEEFISLWIRIQQVHLMPGTPDTIIWRWIESGAYSTRSAYRIQFSGSFRAFRGDLIWKVHTENKCKVFAWIMAREKALTADNLQKTSSRPLHLMQWTAGNMPSSRPAMPVHQTGVGTDPSVGEF